jgi:hypothetical protein
VRLAYQRFGVTEWYRWKMQATSGRKWIAIGEGEALNRIAWGIRGEVYNEYSATYRQFRMR